ncbi:hypothetical protein L226DRAFT_199803 [Lentinus tigrinus ALCF2SS1-7]|uniref:uncharacterized protein n=1 Tax=Lentinus tigrinus ALCF2SS1-7 TaxID=1328758 RepID=UPI001165DB8E|nr:hypothetical protein L226DRAFT_199803 [Lentinus tigrinus ALCF2SS1-7]
MHILFTTVSNIAQLRAQPTPSYRHSFVLHVPPAGHRPPLVPSPLPCTRRTSRLASYYPARVGPKEPHLPS